MQFSAYWCLLCLALCVWTTGKVHTQATTRVIYPVKQGHLWGFMSKRGDLLIPPRYDAVGSAVDFLVNPDQDEEKDEFNYRLVELNGKLGVINQNLQEVLPCNNEFVLPVSVSQFLVKQEEGYTVLDSAGQNLTGRYYSQLEFAGATEDGAYYYTIFDEGKKGLINAQGDTLLPCRYVEIKPLAWQTAPFLVRARAADNYWRLVARGGRTLRSEVVDAKAPHPGMVLVAEEKLRPERYQAFTPNGKPITELVNFNIDSGEYLSPELVNLRHYVASKKKFVHTLYQVREQEQLFPGFTEFRALDGQYCTGTANRKESPRGRTFQLETLITPQGTYVDSAQWFLRLDQWEGAPEHFRARKRGGWGVINRNGQEIVPFVYDSIGPVEEGLAIIVRNRSLGVIQADGRAVAATNYTRVTRIDTRLILEDGGDATVLYLNDSLRVVSFREYQKLRTLMVTPPSLYRIAGRLDFEQIYAAMGSGAAPDGVTMDELLNEEVPDTTRLDPWFIRRDSLSGRGLIITTYTPTPAAEDLGIDSAFVAAHQTPVLGPEYFIRIYGKQKITPSPYLQQLVIGKDLCARPLRLLADGIGKLTQEPMLGFRIFDLKKPGWRYAPALRANGRFFLLGTDAEPLRSPTDSIMEFTFVGKANNGLLRVCVGGVLASSEEIPQEPLPSLNGLLRDFTMRLPCGRLASSNNSLVVLSTPADSARWGVLDTLGRWVVEPVYDYIEENVLGQMVARQGDLYGVINAEGDTIVPFQYRRIVNYKGFWRVNDRKIGEVYFNWRGHQIADVGIDSVSIFRQGHSAQLDNDRWSYINMLGQILGEADYLQARPFGEGLAAVKLDSTQWAFVDTSGQLRGQLPVASFDDLSFFSSGRCRFRRGRGFGFLDRSLQEVPLPRLFQRASNFDRGRAIVKVGPGVAVIDTAGTFLIEPGEYNSITPWNDLGLAVATRASNGKNYLVDLQGQPLHEEPFDTIVLKGGPLYPARQGRNWGYVNGVGKLVIPLNYSWANPFVEGYARVKKLRGGDRWIFINQAGRPINKQTYGSTDDFSGGVAYVKNVNEPARLLQPNGRERRIPNCDDLFVDGTLIGCNDKGQNGKKAFFADHNGSQAFLQTYDEIKPFGSGEMAFVKEHGRWGIIDRRGMQLVTCKYYFVDDTRPDGFFKVGPPAFGIYDRSGKMIVPVEFDNLELMEKGLFRVERGEKVGYLSIAGEEVWPLQN